MLYSRGLPALLHFNRMKRKHPPRHHVPRLSPTFRYAPADTVTLRPPNPINTHNTSRFPRVEKQPFPFPISESSRRRSTMGVWWSKRNHEGSDDDEVGAGTGEEEEDAVDTEAQISYQLVQTEIALRRTAPRGSLRVVLSGEKVLSISYLDPIFRVLHVELMWFLGFPSRSLVSCSILCLIVGFLMC